MATTLKDIKAAIKTKLQDINGSGDDYFGDIFDYPNGKFENYPVAVIRQTGASGLEIDTHRNERTFHFVIELYQEQSQVGKNKQLADQIMTDAADAILIAFDQDKTLGGEVELVTVIEANFDFRVSAGTYSFATFKVDCRVVLPNYH